MNNEKVFTGLCDKGGTKVYVGDFIHVRHDAFHPDMICEVVETEDTGQGNFFCKTPLAGHLEPLDSILSAGNDWVYNHVENDFQNKIYNK